MDEHLEELLGTLLYEGYALYPYTPGAAKNSTPTPFGIVYPPAYAAGVAGAHDRLEISGIAIPDEGCTIEAEVRFLVPDGAHAHSAAERRLQVGPLPVGETVTVDVTEPFDVGTVSGRVRLRVVHVADGLSRITLCVHNGTELAAVPGGRAEALRSSMLSTHPVLRLSGGRFASPLERDGAVGAAVETCENVNTFPVLATPGDDVLLGAAVVLPDHPQLAPESRGDLFDGTEIEEALLLHVLALSDGERDEIARHDPAVRAMIERAAAATPADIFALHGRLVLTDPPIEERP
jgi:hypothetical protein